MTSRDATLVSVVIPAYNAARTIGETITSVRTQTHTQLDIIIVDDGSKDETAAIAQAHADEDPRITLIRQPNAGVAAARNTGWTNAKSHLIAFVDADDLWSPTKIERQLEAFIRGGEKIGLVYCYFTRIDAQNRITEYWNRIIHEGDVFDELLLINFVGNGSTPMITREALERAGGFRTSLREAGAQGCDDFLLCCRVAESYHFAAVPEILVGYRDLAGSISSNNARMLRSWMLSMDELRARHPHKADLLRRGLYNYAEWMIRRAVFQRRPGQVPPVLYHLIKRYPRVAARIIAIDLPLLAAGVTRRLLRRAIRPLLPAKAPAGFEYFQIGTLEKQKEVVQSK